jgi:competence protein ComEC
MIDIAVLVAGWSTGLTGNPLLANWTLLLGLAALGGFAFFKNRWRFPVPALAALAIVIFGFEPRPDVLVSDTTQAVAVTDGSGMALAAGRTGSFAVDVWSQDYQIDIGAAHTGARCDGLGCVVSTPAFSLAIVTNAAAFAEDCGRHDLVVARVYAPAACNSTAAFIGPNELRAGGVHWLHWNAAVERFDIRRAIPNVNRPWRAAPQ